MSKYSALWEYVRSNGSQSFNLIFEEVQNIVGIPIDHSFLKYKKELTEYGYQVGKIYMKARTVSFSRIDGFLWEPERVLFFVGERRVRFAASRIQGITAEIGGEYQAVLLKYTFMCYNPFSI